ncbi:hypothetical protein C8R43DRAFT_1041572 [Mycena crocata]|nr:hypothetical protein C8R43DRAFT_1041572 [Mycena crocata]
MSQTRNTLAMAHSPLLGDADGKYRIHLVGNSGSGKTTLGNEIAQILNVPLISLDTLYFTPGWGHCTTEELRAKLRAVLDGASDGWVVDGNYGKRIGSIVETRATDIIWLDPPLILYFPRIFIRTVLGLLGLRPPCSPGCPERFLQTFFSRESILWYCITYHFRVRRREQERMKRFGVETGSDVGQRKMRRLGGWGGEAREWMEGIRRLVEKR